MTCFEDCRRIRIHDVILRNAANWTLHFTGCEDVVVTGVSILNPRDFPNCDGIDPDHCRNVRINNCHIEAGDDCIVIKNTAPFSHYGPTENIVVSNCTLESTSCAIKIGSESFNDFRNLVFTNCVIDDSNRGLGIQLRDSGNVENVIFSDMVVRTRLFEGKWWGAGEPIYVTALPRNHQTRPGRVRNIRFTNLMCHSECGAVIHGCDDSRIENLLLDNVRLELRRRTQHPAGRFDMRPCPVDVVYDYTPQAVIGQETPWGAAMHRRMPGVFAYQARNLALRHVHIDWDRPLPEEYSYALECHAVTGLAMDHFVGDAAHRGQEPAHVVE